MTWNFHNEEDQYEVLRPGETDDMAVAAYGISNLA